MYSPDIFIPGLSIKLVALGAVRSRFISRLIGYKVGQYLVVEWPKVSGTLVRIENDSEWSISFISGGRIFSFSGIVLGGSRQPIPLLFIRYPAKVDKTNLRQERRIPIQLEVALNRAADNPDEEAVTNGVVRDISEGGCQVVTTAECQLGDVLEMILRLPNGDRIDDLRVEVKSHQKLGNNFLLGLRFTPGRKPEGQHKLRDFVDGLKAMPLRL